MKKSKVLASALSIALLSNTVLPATKIAEKTPALSSVAYAAEESSQAKEAKDKLNYLGSLIEGLENIAGGLAGNPLSWLKELKNAYDLTSKLLNRAIGSVSDLTKSVIPRIDLLINVAETITADATELADSEQQAHVIIGFSVTRALLKATNIFEKADGLNKASENLTASLEKAREIPKLTDDSKRTHYTLQQLDRALSRAKEARNTELKNKLDPSALAEFDLLIKKATDVRRNNFATVAEVKAITEELVSKTEEAYKSIPEGEKTANKSTKLVLEKDIKAAKNLRDFSLKGKVDGKVIQELNREIADANRVLNNSRATINEVEAADEIIVAATNKALGKLEEVQVKEKAEEVEETIPEVEEPVIEDETVEEESTEEVEDETPVEEIEETTEDEEVEEELEAETEEVQSEETPVEEASEIAE
ncbi:CAMP factor family pore-forming toxin [Anaerococcus sp. ENR1011]|uniref:cAMP factor family pore-forming toxin n=1 Tax=Anaerococcus groningensis TaxID=3115616 RepID=A0ABW9MYL9_9FIRM